MKSTKSQEKMYISHETKPINPDFKETLLDFVFSSCDINPFFSEFIVLK